MQYQIGSIPAGEAGTDATLKVMGRAVEAALRRPHVRIKATQIIQTTPVLSDPSAAVSALHRWVRGNIRYIQDPIEIETVQTPEVTLELRAGDCDDHAVLMVALAGSIGIPGRFRVVGLSRGNLQHVYPELLVNGAWVPADTTTMRSLGESMPAFPATKTYNFKGGVMPALGSPVRTVVNPVTATRAVYQTLLQKLSNAWYAGRINENDLAAMYVKAEREKASNPALADLIKRALSDWQNNVDTKGLRSRKREGLSGLGSLGIFGELLNVAKSAYNTVTGSGKDPAPLWDRLGPIQVGYALQAGGVPVDSAYAAKINAQYNSDINKALTGKASTINFSNVVWATAPSGALDRAVAAYSTGTQTRQPAAPTGSLFSVTVPSGLITTQVSPDAARAGVAEMLGSPTVLIPLALAAVFVLPKLLKR